MKTALVTGASRGIGKATALRLAKDGFAIAVNYRGADEAAAQTVAEIEAIGGKAIAYKCDVSDFAAAAELIAKAEAELGPIAALVCNAGITRDALLLRMKEADFDAVINTNLKGVWNCVRHMSPLMARRREGSMVLMASISGVMGNAGQTNYSAAKAGVIGLAKATAREFASRNITVNAVAPGLIEDTDMVAAMPQNARDALVSGIPLGRMGRAEEVAALVSYLCSENARYMTGQTLVIDGGLHM